MQLFLAMKMMRMAHQLGLWNPLSYLPHSMFFSLSQILTRQSSIAFISCMQQHSYWYEWHIRENINLCMIRQRLMIVLFGLSCYVDECATFYTHSHLICNQYPNFLDWMGPSDERPAIISKINYSYIRSTHTVAINLQATCSSKGSMH